MRNALIIGTALTLFTSPALAQETLVIEDFIGKIKVETSNATGFDILDKSNMGNTDISGVSGDELTITGEYKDLDNTRCNGYFGRYSISLFSRKERRGTFGGYEDLEDYPSLTVQAADDVNIIVRNSILFGTFGDVGSVDLEVESCGNIQIGNIQNDARIETSGSTDVETGNVRNVFARTSGSGDLTFGNVAEGDIRTSGSGDIEIKNAYSVDIATSGSGDIDIEDIEGPAIIRTSGSGDVSLARAETGLDFESSGSGDLEVDAVYGDLTLDISGSGDAEIDDGEVEMLKVDVGGSSDVHFDGTAETAELYASGSSDIYVDKVRGEAITDSAHSSDIEIGNQ